MFYCHIMIKVSDIEILERSSKRIIKMAFKGYGLFITLSKFERKKMMNSDWGKNLSN